MTSDNDVYNLASKSDVCVPYTEAYTNHTRVFSESVLHVVHLPGTYVSHEARLHDVGTHPSCEIWTIWGAVRRTQDSFKVAFVPAVANY